MRLDRWLKLSRLIKRRTVAQMACFQGRVFVNDLPAKPHREIKVGDQVHLELGSRALTIKVLTVPDKAISAACAPELYQLLEEIRRKPEVLEWQPNEEW